MTCKHIITSRDKWFLDRHMKDPVAQEPFKIGDSIVICAKCKTVHYDSSWNLNSNKCCSMGCNHSRQLSFNKFSPAIFQLKPSGNAKFKVIEEKLPFREKIGLINWYPIANFTSILIPILVFVLTICVTQCQTVPLFNTAGLFEESRDRFADIMTNSILQFEKIDKKLKSVDVDFGEMSYKLTNGISSFNEAESKVMSTKIMDKLQSTEINGKLSNVGEKMSETADHAGKKLTQFFDLVSEFIDKVLE